MGKNNDLKTEELRNLKYFSELQTNLTNYFMGKIIDFINNKINKEYLQNTFSYLNFNNFDLIINDMNNLLFNGPIVVYDNFFKIIYICKNGNLIYDIKYNILSDYKNIIKDKNHLSILFEYNFNSNNINKIKSIYF